MRIEDEKIVAGISCNAVLAVLSDYLDGDLAPAERDRVEAHLRGCDACARFGGELRATIRALREHLLAADRPQQGDAVVRRLREALPRDR